jgi:NAD(P)-dependent dehydrogenase (short-subunit alcohol dehydrogenase family)
MRLAEHGVAVVLACRSTERGGAALERLRKAVPSADATLASLDLADLASVRAFAAEHGGEPLHLLVNNAGVMALPRVTTADGFEMQFGTNHLGHFALTGLLLPDLQAAPDPRVVTVTSMAAWGGRIHFDDLQWERRYWRWPAYAQSKVANLLFAKELDRRFSELVSVAAHPGYAATNLTGGASRFERRGVRDVIFGLGDALLAQSSAAGAWPLLYAATAPGVTGGECYGPRGVGQQRGRPTRVRTTGYAARPDVAQRLWKVSEQLTGVSYPAAD